MAEDAGELSLDVVADLRGFGKRLKADLEKATRNIKIRVPVEPDSKGLRDRLREVVDKAGAGVAFQTAVAVDSKGLRDRLRTVVDKSGTGVNFQAGVNVDSKGLRERLRVVVAAASSGQKATIGTDLDAKTLGVKARTAKEDAQKKAGTIKIPVELDVKKSAAGLAGVTKLLKFPAIAAAIGPLVGLVSALSAGLVALAAAMSPVVGLAGLAPAAITSLAQAFGTLKVSMSGVGDAFKAVSSAQEKLRAGQKLTADEAAKLRASLAALSPSAQSFVRQITRIKPAFDSLRRAVQESFFKPFVGQVSGLARQALPLLRTSLSDTAGVMGRFVASLGQAFSRGGLFKDFRSIMGNNVPILSNLSKAALSLVRAFTDVAVVAGPLLIRFSELAAKGANAIFSFTTIQRSTGGMARFFDRAAKVGGQLFRILKNVVVGLLGIGKAGAPLGQDLLNSVEKLTARFAAFTKSISGQSVLRKWFNDAKPAITESAKLIGAIFKAIAGLGTSHTLAPLLAQIRTQFLPALQGLLANLNGSLGPALITGATALLDLFTTLTASGGGGLTSFVSTITLFIEAVNKIIKTVPGAGTALTTFFVAAGGAKALLGIAGILGGAGKAIFKVGQNAAAAAGGVGSFFRGLSGGGGAGGAASGAAKAGKALRDFASTAASVGATAGRGLASGIGKGADAIGRLATASAGVGTRGVKALGSAVASAAVSVGRFAAAQTGAALTGLRTLGAALVSTAISYTRLAVAATASALATARQTIAAIASRVASVAVAVGTAIWTAAQWLLNVALTANPIGVVIVAVGLLIAAIVLIATKTTWFQTIWTTVWNFVKAHWLLVVTILTGGLGLLVGLFIKHFGAIKSFVVGIWNTIVGVFRTALAAARTAVASGMSAIRSVVSGAINGVLAVIRGVSNIVGIVRNAFNSARAAAGTAIDTLLGLVRGLPGKIVSALGNLSGLLVRAGREIIDGLVAGIRSAPGAIVNAIKAAAGKFARFLPGSPVKEGPLRVLNRGYAGRQIVRMLVGGVTAESGRLSRAAAQFAAAFAEPIVPAVAGHGPGTLGALTASFGAAGQRAGVTTTQTRTTNVTVNAAPDVPTSQQILRVLSYAEALHA